LRHDHGPSNQLEAAMAHSHPRPSGPVQAARPSAAAAKVTQERYQTFHQRMDRLAEAARQASRPALANQLVDLGQRVEDREVTLEEGMAELRELEAEIRAMLKR
jgi:hypothetical protein